MRKEEAARFEGMARGLIHRGGRSGRSNVSKDQRRAHLEGTKHMGAPWLFRVSKKPSDVYSDPNSNVFCTFFQVKSSTSMFLQPRPTDFVGWDHSTPWTVGEVGWGVWGVTTCKLSTFFCFQARCGFQGSEDTRKGCLLGIPTNSKSISIQTRLLIRHTRRHALW